MAKLWVGSEPTVGEGPGKLEERPGSAAIRVLVGRKEDWPVATLENWSCSAFLSPECFPKP